jgi:hypothetical protein
MKLSLNKIIYLLGIGITFHCTGGGLQAGSLSEINDLQQKYPKQAVIVSQKKLDVTISLVNNVPVITLDSYKELTVLGENVTFLSDSKEYFSSHLEMKKLEAYSLVPDRNQYKKLTVQTFKKSMEIDNSVFYDDQYAYGFTFPSVVQGARLITKYTASAGSVYIPVRFDFGGGIPSENMIVTLTCPKAVQISFKLFGKDTSIVQFKKTSKGDKMIYQWQASNAKCYDRDTEAPGLRYFIPHLVVQLAGYTVNNKYTPVIGSLKDLYAFNYSNVSNLQTLPSADIRVLADSITSQAANGREKVRLIFKWVQKNIKYIAIEDGDNGFVPREASLVLKRRYGDCKDKTSILVAMIRSQGLKASFAWIGSRHLPYKYSEFASLVDGDHMIAVWWDEHDAPVILDGTTYSHSMENVPAFIQGKECLIEKGKDDYFLYTIPVAAPVHNAVYDSLSISLRGDTVRGKGFARFEGESKADIIYEFEGKDTSLWKDVVMRHLQMASNKTNIRSVKISNIYDIDAPFTIEYDFNLPDYLIKTRQNTYINLYLDRYLQKLIIREDRWMPLESEMTLDHSFICSMQIPGGLKVNQLPDGSAYDHPGFSFREKYSGDTGRIVLSSKVTINFQVIDGPDLNAFREMLSLLNHNYSRTLPLEKSETL